MQVELYETLANLNGERLDFIFFFFLDKKETKKINPPRRMNFSSTFYSGPLPLFTCASFT